MSPLLTRAQFAKTDAAKKSGASWNGYVHWVTKTHAARVAARARNPLGALTQQLTASILTPAEQIAQANKAVTGQITTAEAGMDAASKAQQLATQNQATRAQGYATALAHLTENTPEAVKATYQDAADRMRLYGTGLTGAVEASQQAAAGAAAEHLAAQGAPAMGAPTYDPASMRNTLQMAGVVAPGMSLEEEAANAATLARGQNVANVMQVGGIAQQYLQKTQDLRDQLALQKTALEKTRPGLYQTAIGALRGEAAKTQMSLLDQQRQQRALDVQVGTLQLQQAKTLADQAVAWTNLTGSVFTVAGQGAKAHLVNTHVPAPGSDAAQIAQTAATAAAGQTAMNIRAAADRKVRIEIANAANAARVTAAQTTATAKVTAAGVAAAATKAAARIKAQAARDPNKPASLKDRRAILSGTNTQGNDLVKTSLNRIWSLVPRSEPQQKGEDLATYQARHQQAINIFQARQQEHRAAIVARVNHLITPQLQLLKYGPDQIAGMADAIVSAYIPKRGRSTWVGLLH